LRPRTPLAALLDQRTQALAEFKKNPKLFTFEKGYTAETFRNAA